MRPLESKVCRTDCTFNNNTASTLAPDFYTPPALTVTSLADDAKTAGTLRALVARANTNADANVIVFHPSLSGQTITLIGSQLTLSNTVTIDASALPGGISISGPEKSGVLNVASNANVVLNSLTITDGNAGGILNSGKGLVVQQPPLARGEPFLKHPVHLRAGFGGLGGFVDGEWDAVRVVYNGLVFLVVKHTQPRTEFFRSACAEVVSICFNGAILPVPAVKTLRIPRKRMAGAAGLEPCGQDSRNRLFC